MKTRAILGRSQPIIFRVIRHAPDSTSSASLNVHAIMSPARMGGGVTPADSPLVCPSPAIAAVIPRRHWMRNAWRIALALVLVSLGAGGAAWAGVPKVVMVEDFTATW